ncbi:MAG: D-alanyl-D-alanine endopeptidase [Betaproteobacteria bacterium]|nr:D-alanyl-D-alanine endopeptidase [Betaproteobacteria bacterium]
MGSLRRVLVCCVLAALGVNAYAGESAAILPSSIPVAHQAKRIHIKVRHKIHREPAVKRVSSAADGLHLRSGVALVVDQDLGQPLYAKNPEAVMPIASITKLMTAMVVLDAKLPLDETVAIDAADVDTLKNTGSRLRIGMEFTRAELLRLALMSSENRAAAALGRAYPGGAPAFVAAMNLKAIQLGMSNSRFVDSTGLNSGNVSTAQDLARMVRAAYDYDLIRDFTTTPAHEVDLPGSRRTVAFRNSNSLVRSGAWDIGLSKTGFISEAGRCLVMQATIASKPVIIVLLDSWGRLTRVGDANRIKKWMESGATLRQRFS